MKITIQMEYFIKQSFGGIPRYLEAVTSRLINDVDLEGMVYQRNIADENEFKFVTKLNESNRHTAKLICIFKYYLSFFFKKKRLVHDSKSVLWLPVPSTLETKGKNYSSKVITVHDVGPIDVPQYYDRKTTFLWRIYLHANLYDCDHIIVPSNFTKRRLLVKIDFPEDKITVVPHGVELKKNTAVKYKNEKSYFFYLGPLSLKKNSDNLIRAVRLLSETIDFQLIIVGENLGLEPETQKILDYLKERKIIKFLYKIPDDELIALYENAIATIVPSRYEGFGLPILEAARHSSCVIASDIDVFTELDVPGVNFFETENYQSLCDLLIKAVGGELQSPALNAETYNWNKSASGHLAVFEAL
ncbi:glycosyltransferase family 4 protein [Vibrio cyclitrophicus]|uniref:glycosyltransferase family 4 protein n=1 Tax=Vibrio cyclitrophicus TaxID=47951 RepID=UPI0002F44D5E|nr:glycosyltransferase family 1 protein [Vibrio cyclitrophicus]OEF43718.1 hypothetical protein OAC_09775 [Vibrio cyclitrophicus 1F273]